MSASKPCPFRLACSPCGTAAENHRRDGASDGPHLPLPIEGDRTTTDSIRPIVPADTPALLTLSGSLGFGPDELAVLEETFVDYHARNAAKGYRTLVCDDAGSLVAMAYVVPMPMTDRTWELVMIVVDGRRQGEGLGGRMLEAAEDAARAAEGRLMLVETSTTDDFAAARRFYAKHGYAEVARIPDAFADGDGKVVLTKRL